MTTETEASRLRRQLVGHPFMKGLEESDVDTFASLGRPVDFAAGDIIFQASEPADTFYLIRSGVVALEVGAGSAYPRTIQSLTEGAALGWSWLFSPFLWEFDAVAQTPVRALAFDAATLRDRFEGDPACGYRVMARVAQLMAERLQATRYQLLDLAP